jgi:hypothetical protein
MAVVLSWGNPLANGKERGAAAASWAAADVRAMVEKRILLCLYYLWEGGSVIVGGDDIQERKKHLQKRIEGIYTDLAHSHHSVHEVIVDAALVVFQIIDDASMLPSTRVLSLPTDPRTWPLVH